MKRFGADGPTPREIRQACRALADEIPGGYRTLTLLLMRRRDDPEHWRAIERRARAVAAAASGVADLAARTSELSPAREQ